ncbi:hypothetical protein JOD02_002325 [Caldicoprobacter guelmensis]|uniref:hypothetical protein n=1 Tax=Caldicoprobacter guelmensis TaxID=1170224 RepID=UPI00195724FB|nr:hypothetical protein [Caldicoprobacter guelmensis]MBM7583443.1 hypothetical protein [Caldicoprobacter guelmensis]
MKDKRSKRQLLPRYDLMYSKVRFDVSADVGSNPDVSRSYIFLLSNVLTGLFKDDKILQCVVF